VTLNNGSLAPLVISSITTDHPDFTQTNSCGASLATHKNCTIHVFFKPSAPLAETATLTIAGDSTNSPQTVALTGIGTVTPIVVFRLWRWSQWVDATLKSNSTCIENKS
jgi:centrosomal CEP192-like protein